MMLLSWTKSDSSLVEDHVEHSCHCSMIAREVKERVESQKTYVDNRPTWLTDLSMSGVGLQDVRGMMDRMAKD